MINDEDYIGNEMTIALLSDHYCTLTGFLLEPVPGEMHTFRRVGIMKREISREASDAGSIVPWEQKFITVR